jgi:two-component system CheB/CheR fusion protein
LRIVDILPGTSQKHARILVVEDNPESLSAYVKLLQLDGFYVKGADGYQSATETAEREPFDLLLSGIQLWDGDGCDLLHESQRKYEIKAIAVTGFGQPEDLQRCLDAGFTYHILKPVVIPTLLKTIAAVLEKIPLSASLPDAQPMAGNEGKPCQTLLSSS